MGTSPELRVHPPREISAPRPGMRYHARHETDATTRDDRAMDAARVPDPARDGPRDDRDRDRDDARARALLERRRRRRHDALRRVGVCSSTPDRRRHDPEPRDDRDARGETRDDARFDARHDGHFRSGRETFHRAHPDGALADVAHDLRRELNRMTASRRAAAAAASAAAAAASRNARGPSASPARIDAERRRRARRAATADAVARYRREVLVRMRIVDDENDDDDASTLRAAPARQLASRAVRAALRRERAATEDVVTKEGDDDDVRCERETAEKDADDAAARTSASGRSSATTPPPTADETNERDGSAGADSGTDTGGADSGTDTGGDDTGADTGGADSGTDTGGADTGGADTGADSGADTPRARDSCSSETRAVAEYAEFFAGAAAEALAAADADDALAAARATRWHAPEPTFEPSDLERLPRVSSSRVAAARLERAWRALRTPFAARVDAAIKFSTPPWRAMFPEALDAWERAAAAVVARERSVVRMEALVARKRAGEDETPDSDEIEAFADVEAATLDVARAARTLRAFDETLCVQGAPYLAEFIAQGA